MSKPWTLMAIDGFVVGNFGEDNDIDMYPWDAAELLHALESDPSAFLAELRAAVDEAHKQRRQG